MSADEIDTKTTARKALGARLRQVREAPPYWSRPDLARLLRAAADPRDRPGLPHVKTLAEMIKHWENGKHAPGDRYRPLYCRVTGMTGRSCSVPRRGPCPAPWRRPMTRCWRGSRGCPPTRPNNCWTI
ncbi:hypothetical protein GCM10010182_82030 [Actinomadura cremea]|nr:hypothetical protein GCM10010182_82030 [Actinomadura cremea]